MAHGPDAIREWAGPRRVDRVSAFVGQSPTAVQLEPAVIRVAFLGRTSTYDQQDPTLSLPRQFRNCVAALPENATLTAYFYDIESGRKEADVRSGSRAHEMFDIDIPRDGGIQELLDEAARPGRRFDVVICEDISRIARRTYIGTQIEHQLEQLGVPLFAVDEGVRISEPGKRTKTATQILTRRVKQGVAEWYVTEMLEKSWDGFETHTDQGYNVGKPCYGYRADHIKHPVPAKRAKGMKKTKLKVHEVEGAVVRKVYEWRVSERLGYQAIADRLNKDLTTNPPPVPVDPTRAVGVWTYSSVREVLTNPKHTGHMVWNRRARKGNGKNKLNPPTEWVWSPKPSHEALVDLETFVLAQQVAPQRERSRTSPGKSRDPQAKVVYPLRSFVYCELCGRRMCGNKPTALRYYACAPKRAWRPEGHPTICRVREDSLLEALESFLDSRLFGAYRQDLLDRNLKDLDHAGRRNRVDRIRALERALADNATKSKNLLRTLEVADDVSKEMVRDINERRAELKVEKASLEAQLEEAEETARQAPNADLLHELPLGAVRLDGLPDELSRQLFEALRLEIRYDHATQKATCRVTLVGESLAAVTQVLNRSNVVPLPVEIADSSATSKEGQQMASSSTSSSMMVCVASRRGHHLGRGRQWCASGSPATRTSPTPLPNSWRQSCGRFSPASPTASSVSPASRGVPIRFSPGSCWSSAVRSRSCCRPRTTVSARSSPATWPTSTA
ncbi:Site-specific DNA recombinase [Amycolatopsis tolypomycina]|uniref:Site-specific DNA recombinase n=1 Tax=Amycolatopsis tolypomycina TaxID=208445 RepID=A0A1H5C4W4_9PSEU|nr:recombinase family protein [Amycolatopsis tolypomycina]SED61802.1 Site-specific DNA recombinase [Amycolatopsis tolypomycina]